jgi:hypothetical protein
MLERHTVLARASDLDVLRKEVREMRDKMRCASVVGGCRWPIVMA